MAGGEGGGTGDANHTHNRVLGGAPPTLQTRCLHGGLDLLYKACLHGAKINEKRGVGGRGWRRIPRPLQTQCSLHSRFGVFSGVRHRIKYMYVSWEVPMNHEHQYLF